MKKRLKPQEIFLPLAGGTDTEADPHTPRATMITKNADTSVQGVIRKREPLATLYGDKVADSPSNAWSSIGEVPFFMSPSEDSRTVVYFGAGIHETNGNGIVRTSNSTLMTRDAVATKRVLFKSSESQLPSFDHSVASANISSTTYHAVATSGVGRFINDQTGSMVSQSDVVSVTGGDSYIFGVHHDGTNGVVYRFDGSSVSSANATWTNVVTSSSMHVRSTDDSYVICLGTDSTTTNHAPLTTAYSSNAVQIDTDYIGVAGGAVTATMAITGNKIAVSARNSTNIRVSHFTDTSGTIQLDDSWINATVSDGSGVGQTTAWISDTHIVTLWNCEGLSVQPYVRGSVVSASGSTTEVLQSDILYGFALTSQLLPMPGSSTSLVATCRYYGGIYNSALPEELYNPQNVDFIFRFDFDSSGVTLKPYPIGIFSETASRLTDQFFNLLDITRLPQLYSYVDREGTTRYYTAFGEYNKYGKLNSASLVDIEFAKRGRRPVSYGGYAAIPGGAPSFYDGQDLYPMGYPVYPSMIASEGSANGSSNWTESGGLGTYNFCITFVSQTSIGDVQESSPSFAKSVDITGITNVVTMELKSTYLPFLYSGQNCLIDIYQTDESSSYYYRANTYSTNGADNASITYSLLGQSSAGTEFIVGQKYFIQRPLYTMNGDLENTRARQHIASTVHKGRYIYCEYGTDICYYSKAKVPGIVPEFNEVLQIPGPGDGGDGKCLQSLDDKLYMFKERSLYATYGEPLNNSGAGDGFADFRLVSKEYGCKYQTAAAAARGAVFFVNAVDGLIYTLTGNDQVQYIGGNVRHYCETYEYAHVWVNPRQSCVRFASETVGAPTLSFDYKHNIWSTFDGRYALGTIAAFAAPVGKEYGLGTNIVDVIMDTNGYVYIQDPTSTYGTVESYNVEIETGWIPLNDIAGFGKFYKWVLVGSKPSANCNLVMKTAYDYEPYWVDSQTYNATATVEEFGVSDHFGAMTNSAWVGKSLQIDVDGSRHKCEAVRLHISTNNGTERDNIEIAGARLEIGVREGRYRVGGSRRAA